MPHEVKIPALGESITGGMISKWHKNDGDQVKSGDVLLTLETDKVAQDIIADNSGVLHIKVKEGEEAAVGAVVATIEEGQAAAPSAPEPQSAAPAARTTPQPPEQAIPPAAPAREETQAIASETESKAPEAEAPAPAKPSAAAPAPQLKIVPRSEPGSKPAPTVAAPPEGRVTRKRMTPLRKRVAEQLVAAQRSAAILTTFNECDMSAVMKMRKELQDTFVKKHGVKLGFMSFFVKAVVDALKAVPQINVRVDGDDIIFQHFYDIGVAVGTDRGLIVPVLRDCDSKTFADIEREILDFAGRAKEGKIQLEELTGGVFTISNGGVYGSLLSTPILNPPQSGILGLHAIKERPMAVDGQVVIRPMMYLALSYDHRVVDGREAVTFLIRVKDCIENPARLLLGT